MCGRERQQAANGSEGRCGASALHKSRLQVLEEEGNSAETRISRAATSAIGHDPSLPLFLLMPSPNLSLDDSSSVASSYDSDEEYHLAQKEWEESLSQLQQLVAVVLLPFFGKWLGRRWSHIGATFLAFTPN